MHSFYVVCLCMHKLFSLLAYKLLKSLALLFQSAQLLPDSECIHQDDFQTTKSSIFRKSLFDSRGLGDHVNAVCVTFFQPFLQTSNLTLDKSLRRRIIFPYFYLPCIS